MRCYLLVIGLVLASGMTWGADQQPGKPGRSFQIPYRLTELQHVVVRLKINGQGPFNFIVDTGAPIMFVAKATAKKIGLETEAKGLTVLDRLEIEGGASLTKVACRVETPFQLEGMNGLGLAGVELHGILGYTILARYRMEFDFSRPKMVWTELDFQPPPPQGIKGKGGGGGLEILGSLMKFLGFLAGAKAAPEEVPRGFLGIQFAPSTTEPVIGAVMSKGPAAQAGLQAGDRIEEFEGKKLRTLADFQRRISQVLPGQTVRLGILRGTQKKEITITAGEGL